MRKSIIMDKAQWKKIVLAFAIALILLVVVLLLTNDRADTAARDQALAAAGEGLDHYAVDIIFRPEEHTLAITETITLTNRSGVNLNDVVLRTYAGAFATEDTSPAAMSELYDLCYPDGFSAGGVAVQGLWWNGQVVQASYDDEAQTVLRVAVPAWQDDEQATLKIRCVVTVPVCAYRFGYSSGIWMLGNALPILSVYQGGAWRTDSYEVIGDPFVSECANYDIALTVPDGYVPACSVPLAKKDGVYRGSMQAVREVALAISDAYVTAEGKVDGITVRAYAKSKDAARQLVSDAQKALSTLGALYGAYPYPVYTLCEVDFPFGGMEYPGLAMVGGGYLTTSMRDSLELIIAHETAHQWFYGVVGSDQVNDPWLDEGLSEYALLKYVQKRHGMDSMERLKVFRVDAPMQENIVTGITPGSPLSYFSNYDEYDSVVYGRGAALFLALDTLTEGKLDAFLKAYVHKFSYQLITREQFADFLAEYTGQDYGPMITDYIDTIM